MSEAATAEQIDGRSFVERMSSPEFIQEWDKARQADKLPTSAFNQPTGVTQVDNEEAEWNELQEAIGEKPAPKVETPKVETKPEPKTEAKVEVKEDDFAPKSKKASEQWKKFKEETSKQISEKDQRIAELSKEIEAARAGGASKSELDLLRQERDQERKLRSDFEDQLKLLAVERHPKFQEYFDNRMNQVINIAKGAAGEHGERVAQLLRMPDSDYKTQQLDEIANTLGGIRGAKLGAALLEYEKVQGERQAEVSKYRERYDQMVQSQKQEQERRFAEQNQQFDSYLNQISDPTKGMDFWKPRENDADWNNALAERKALARAVYAGELPNEDRAKAAFWAAAAPEILKTSLADKKTIADLQKELASLKAAKPSLSTNEGKGRVVESSDNPNSFTDSAYLGRLAAELRG